MDILLIIGAIGGLLGCSFVALGHPWYANITWAITNPFMVYHNYLIGEYGQMTLWSIYICLAIFGVIRNWRK